MLADKEMSHNERAAPASEARSDSIRFEQTDQLFAHVGMGLAVTIANAGILVYAVHDDIPNALIFGWLTAVTAVVILRAILLIAYRQTSPDNRKSAMWRHLFDAGTLAMGLTWGAATLCAFSETNIANQMFLGFVLGGMAAGAVSTLAFDFRTYLLFLIPCLTPFIIRLLATGAEPHISMGVMACLFTLVLVASGRRYHSALKTALELRHANNDLIDELRSAIEKADEASQSKSLFLANMSHEIRTPMNGVFGMTDLLKRTTLSQRQKRLVDTISQSAQTLLTIINDILDLSRIEAGKLELDRVDYDIRHCIEGSVELFIEEAERKSLDLTVFVSSTVPNIVTGDPGRLRQIFVNLLGNAVKFTDNGTVAIEAKAIGTNNPNTPELVVTVSDTGIGIDKELLDRIQDPFVQADSSINRRFGGTGLGLSISKHLISMMSGSMHIDSRKGEGTRITVKIPLEIGNRNAEWPEPDTTQIVGRRVLVVDDKDTNREILKSYLEDFGAKVETAADAREALEILDAAATTPHKFDAAVLDLVMPEINGLELARLIRSDLSLSSLPLVMVTSLSWKGDSKTARETGINELMTKPIRRRDLQEAVSRALMSSTKPIDQDQNEHGEHVQFDGHVLIVEDNPVNQEVGKEYVTSFGCTTKIANNGIEAVAAFETFRFDLILMDCQMPEMDGFVATAKIRKIEQDNGRAPIPIIALTANAFEGDREACLAAGMNDYISKPFAEKDLRSALENWLKPDNSDSSETEPVNEEMLSNLGAKKPDLLRRMTEAYLKHAPQALATIEAGLEEDDLIKIKLSAHSLKSSSANVGATRLSDLCRQIEDHARSEDGTKISDLVKMVRTEYANIERALTETVQQLAPSEAVSGKSPETKDPAPISPAGPEAISNRSATK